MDTTDTGRAATDAATDTTAVTLVTTDEAARLAGVSARTVRRWVQRGLLPSVASEGGQLVSPADLPAAKAAAGGGRGHGRDRGRGHGRAATVIDADADAPPVAVSPAARSQLEAIRDEWLAPLVARIEELARENGALRERAALLETDRDRLAAELARDRGLADRLVDLLQEERDALRRERDRLLGEAVAGPGAWRELAEAAARDTHEASRTRPAAPGAAETPAAGRDPRGALWRLWGRLAGRG